MNLKFTLITLALILISWTAFGQVSFSTADTLYKAVPAGSVDVVAYGLVDNEANQVKTYFWTRNIINITNGWECAICDKNLCYIPTVSTKEFEMGPLETGATMDVHVYPNGIDVGSAFVEMTVEDLNNSSNSTVAYYAFDSNFTGTENISQTFFKVYPNPSAGLFTIEGDETIEEVVIYNTAGQLLKRFQYGNTAEWYDIAELPKGTYMLHLIGQDNETLSSKLISKL